MTLKGDSTVALGSFEAEPCRCSSQAEWASEPEEDGSVPRHSGLGSLCYVCGGSK